MTQKKNYFLRILTCILFAFIGILSMCHIFVFIGICAACCGLIIILKKQKYDVQSLLTLFLFVIPIFGLSLFILTSNFNLDPNAEGYIAQQIFFIIASLLLPFLGYQCRELEGFDLKKIIQIVYKLLAFWMLINLFITLIKFGPFYGLIYKNKYFFEYGKLARLPIDQMAFMFLGFKVERVSVQFFVLFAGILSSAILGLFFVTFKQDKRSFLTYLICGCVGLLCLLFTLNKQSLLVYIPLLIAFSLIVLFAKGIIKFNKVTKIVIYSLCGVAGILFILFVLNALSVQPLADAIVGNKFFNKIFNDNRYSKAYKDIISTVFKEKLFTGFTGYLIGKDSLVLSGSWLFDTLLIGQLFGWVFFITFVVLIFVRYVQYYKVSKEEKSSKVLLLCFILSTLLITLVGYNSIPSANNELYFPIYLIAPFLVLLIIYGYLGKDNKEEKTNE